MENTLTIQEFVAWVKDEKSNIERTTKAMAIEHAAVQLGVETKDVKAWLAGKGEPSKTAYILMRVLMRRNHFVEEPEGSADARVIEGMKKYPCVIFWSEIDKLYLGAIPGLYGPCCHGNTMEEVAIHLEEILIMEMENRLEQGEAFPASSFLIDEDYKITISPEDNGDQA